MSKTAYKLLTDDGAAKYAPGVELGETVSLDIAKDEETAVIAAGWIEHVTKPTKEKE